MSAESLRSYIASAFETAWSIAYPTHKVGYENRKFQSPKDGTPFCYVYVENIDARAASFGTERRYSRHTDMLVIECNVGEDAGVKLLNDMADRAAKIFQEKGYLTTDCAYCYFGTAKIKTQGLSDGYFTKIVMIPIKRTESYV